MSTNTKSPSLDTHSGGCLCGAVRYLVDGAGHMPHMERPAQVQAAIEETIARAG